MNFITSSSLPENNAPFDIKEIDRRAAMCKQKVHAIFMELFYIEDYPKELIQFFSEMSYNNVPVPNYYHFVFELKRLQIT